MNRYPLWKYVLIAVVICLGTLYTVPNFFGVVNAVQISSSRQSVLVDVALMSRVEAALKDADIHSDGMFLDGRSIKIKFKDPQMQLRAREIIQKLLGDNYIIALNQLPNSPVWMSKIGAEPMFLGLDLRGGVHFLLQVDMQAALDKTMERYSGEIRREFKNKKIAFGDITRKTRKDSIEIKFTDASSLNAGRDVLNRNYSIFAETVSADGVKLTLDLKPDELRRMQSDAVKQNIATLHKRVNELGTTEPIIQQSGADRIVIQLPGVQDTAKAKDIIGRTAALEVRMVESDPVKLAELQDGFVPPGYELLSDPQGHQLLVRKQVELTGDNISGATPGFDQNGAPAVHITLDSTGAEIFRQVTAENVGKRMAMILIEKGKAEVVTAPNINEEIGGGRVQISGSMNQAEANDIALLLRAGSLAAPMEIIEERTVGPSLGLENIEKGFHSTLWGFVVVGLFMILYYRVFGMVSTISMSVNLLLLIALLSMLQATLTLPGIAAIALTLGMAIDANVLINERIREELREGRRAQEAIYEGYAHAWRTILDSNVTSLIAGLALLIFGSGPVRGFAVVHCLGILTSMFSSVMVSRAIVNIWYGRRRHLALISIGQIWKPQQD